jgi:hypothetical protein
MPELLDKNENKKYIFLYLEELMACSGKTKKGKGDCKTKPKK